eukprot:g79376.t1
MCCGFSFVFAASLEWKSVETKFGLLEHCSTINQKMDNWMYNNHIYNNPEDPRFWVPMKNKWMGWTINFGYFANHPHD